MSIKTIIENIKSKGLLQAMGLLDQLYQKAIENEEKLAAAEARFAALASENAALKSSRDVLAKNALEACNEIYCAGYRNTALHDGLLGSTGNRNKYPNPIRTLVDESKRSLETPNTDAFLAGVRAQGAEECVRQLVISDADDFSDAPNICAMVAHQLRQGAAQ